MPGLNLNCFIYNLESHAYHNFECPKTSGGPRNCEEIITWFQDLCKEKTPMRLMKQLNGNWSFNFTKESIIVLGRDLAQCLGMPFAHSRRKELFIDVKKNSGNQIVTYNDQDENEIAKALDGYTFLKYGIKMDEKMFKSTGDIFIFGEPESIYLLPFPPRKIELYPNELYIFLNVVKPNVVMGNYKQLLKIVPLPQNERDENITIDFSRLEYHGLSELHPRVLKFEIATVEGMLIEPLDESYNIYRSLQFCHD